MHGVVTGGGLSCDASGRIDASAKWVACRPGFFLPVRVLGRVFRGKYLEGLRQAHARGRLRFAGQLAPLADAAVFHAWLRPLHGKDWVVYAKRPFGGPARVLKYLARYTHRVAISNARLVKMEDGKVTFRAKSYAEDGKQKLLTLDGVEFLRRFVQHVLPSGFVKIRHYGLLANRWREDRLALCRLLLFAAAAFLAAKSAGEPGPVADVGAVREWRCANCGSTRLECRALPRELAACDTS